MKFKPIFLSSTGRAGSTLLMKILSCHSQIAVRTLFPHETRASQYYYLSHLQEQKKPTFLPLKLNGIEYRPFQGNDKESIAWSNKHRNVVIEGNGANLTEDYYRFVSKIENKPQASCFAEKLIGLPLVKQMVQDFKESQVIFLRRDPRDTFFSIKSFNKKRGFFSFGEEAGDEVMFSRLMSYYQGTINFAKSLDSRAVIVRYEDLINSKHDTILYLFKSLELDYSKQQIAQVIDSAFEESKEVEFHRTTNKQKSSLARWKRESKDESLAIFNKFKTAFIILDYEY